MVGLKTQAGAVVAAFILLTAGVAGAAAWNPVQQGEVDVVKNWGASTGETLEPGANTIIPFKQSTASINVRPQAYTMSATSGEGSGEGANRDDSVEVLTNDGVKVDVDVTIRYRVDATKADEFYDEYKSSSQAESELIRPTTRSVLRTEGGDIKTTQIYTGSGQDKMRDAVEAALDDETEGSGIIIEAVQIRRIHLPESYANAVEQKEVEKQKVLQKESEIEREKKEAERKIIEAEGQAESNEIVAESLKNNPELLEMRRIEAIKQNPNTVYVSDGLTMTKEADDNDDE